MSQSANKVILTAAADSALTVPASGTLATLAGTEALTNKTIDGDQNTVQDLGPGTAKVGVTGLTATPVVGSIPFMLTFNPNVATGETLVYAVPAGKTLRVLDVRGYKTAAAAGGAATVQVTNVANPITDAIALTALADKAVFEAGTIDDAYRDVAAATQLRVTSASGANDSCCVVNILCMWV